jgi:hypothetical protein
MFGAAACSTTTSDQPVPVASLDVSPPTISINVGERATLTATPKSASGQPMTARTVSWSSSATNIATVDGVGVVTGVLAGSAVITASSEGVTKQVSVTVLARPRIAVSPASLTFTTVVGSSPAVQTVTITNAGSGTLSGLAVSVQYGAGATGWLGTTLSGTTAQATLTVQPNVSSLAAGNYTATISVTSPVAENSPTTISVTAAVTPPLLLTITGGGTGSGQVTASPAGLTASINCTVNGGVASGTCSAGYASTATVTLTATATGGSTFAGWGGACSGTTCTLPMTSARTVIATFTAAPACVARAYTIGTTVTGSIGSSSCTQSSPTTPHDNYAYSFSQQTLASFSFAAPGFAPHLTPLNLGPNTRFWFYNFEAPGTVSQTILARAGSYTLNGGSATPTGTRSYTLSSVLNPALSGCFSVFSTVGVSAGFTLTTASCTVAPQNQTGTFYTIPFYVNLAAVPVNLTVRVTATAFPPLIEIRDGTTVLASSASQTGSTVSVSTSVSNAVIVYVTSRVAQSIGSFTLTIDP